MSEIAMIYRYPMWAGTEWRRSGYENMIFVDSPYGTQQKLFIVHNEQILDIHLEPAQLSGANTVYYAHPLIEDLSAWRTVLWENEWIQTFEQANRWYPDKEDIKTLEQDFAEYMERKELWKIKLDQHLSILKVSSDLIMRDLNGNRYTFYDVGVNRGIIHSEFFRAMCLELRKNGTT